MYFNIPIHKLCATEWFQDIKRNNIAIQNTEVNK